MTLPCMSQMETVVLLNVARMLATPEKIFFEPLALMIFRAAASSPSNSAAVGAPEAAASGAFAAPLASAAGFPVALAFSGLSAAGLPSFLGFASFGLGS